MKKKMHRTLTAAITVVMMALPAFVFAGGAAIPGRVTVSGNNVTADFNVRFNPAADPNEYINVEGYPASHVRVYAHNGSTWWQCIVFSSNPTLFNAMYQFSLNGGGNGTRLYVTKDNSGLCTSFITQNASYRLN